MKWAEILRSPIPAVVAFLQNTPASEKDENGHDFWEILILESRNRNHDHYLAHLVQLLDSSLKDEKNKISNNKKASLIFFGIKNSADTQILAGLIRNVNLEELIDQNGDSILEAAFKGSSASVANWCLGKMQGYFLSLRATDRQAVLSSFAGKFPNQFQIDYINDEVAASKEYYKSTQDDSEPLNKRAILNRFDEFGQIQLNEIALILEAKAKDSIYIITRDNIPALVDCLLMLLNNNTRQNKFKFQLLFYGKGHTFYGEVVISKETNPPKLKIFTCDPTQYESVTDYFVLPHLKELSKVATVELYSTTELIQKSAKGCTFFATEGCSLLATQKNTDDVYEFMKKHSGTPMNTNGITFVKGLLHPRLKRSSQLYEDETKNMTFFKGIKSTIIDNAEFGNMIVNKRGETATASLDEDLAQINGKVINERLKRKKDGYKAKVELLLHSEKIETYGDVKCIVAKRTITGLQSYCKNQCVELSTLSIK